MDFVVVVVLMRTETMGIEHISTKEPVMDKLTAMADEIQHQGNTFADWEIICHKHFYKQCVLDSAFQSCWKIKGY